MLVHKVFFFFKKKTAFGGNRRKFKGFVPKLYHIVLPNVLISDKIFSCLSLMELQRLYHFAINGLEEEKSAAAKILCGASLTRGWNIQVWN